MRILGLAALALMLGACGRDGGGSAADPWQPASGLWLTTYSAAAGGARSVICYAAGGPGDVFGDSRPATIGPMSCQPVERRATATGWIADQTCTLQGVPGRYHFEARREAGGAVAARTTIADPRTGQELAPPMDTRMERIGDCPEGWSPGEVLRLHPPEPDGRWRVVLPGQGGAPDRIRELATLPPALSERVRP